MVVASATTYIEGFGGEYTSYAVEIRDPRVDRDAGTLSVDVFTGERDGNSAIANNAVYTMTIDGQTAVDGEERSLASTTSEVRQATTLTGSVDPSKSAVGVSVTIAPVGWEDQPETLEFSVEIPEPEPDESLVTIASCSAGGRGVVGEEVVVSATARNDNPMTAPATVTITAGEQTVERKVSLSGGGEQTVTGAFTFDSPGEYESAAEVEL